MGSNKVAHQLVKVDDGNFTHMKIEYNENSPPFKCAGALSTWGVAFTGYVYRGH